MSQAFLPDSTAWMARYIEYVDGAAPSEFIGRITRETIDAIQFEDVTADLSLRSLAHQIHQRKEEIENASDDMS